MNTYQFIKDDGVVIEMVAENIKSAIEKFFDELPYLQDEIIDVIEVIK